MRSCSRERSMYPVLLCLRARIAAGELLERGTAQSDAEAPGVWLWLARKVVSGRVLPHSNSNLAG